MRASTASTCPCLAWNGCAVDPFGIRDAGQLWASNNKDKYLVKVEQHLEGKGIDMFGTFDSTE